MERVIFACVHSAGRSQMAAAFFNVLADPGKAQAIAAGTQPADRVHPVVVESMRDAGIDLSLAHPQRLTDELASGASLLVTMGCAETCPHVPGLQTDDWALEDPKSRPRAEVDRIRDAIRQRVVALIETRGWAKSSRP